MKLEYVPALSELRLIDPDFAVPGLTANKFGCALIWWESEELDERSAGASGGIRIPRPAHLIDAVCSTWLKDKQSVGWAATEGFFPAEKDALIRAGWGRVTASTQLQLARHD